MPGDLLKLDGVCFHGWGATALIDGFSLTLEPNQVLWITGPAGCGKSTLMQIILKGIRPDKGAIHFQKKPLYGRKRWNRGMLRRTIGTIFPDDCLIEERSVFENVALPLRIAGQSRELIAENATHALREVKLLAKSHSTVGKLLGSEKRLVALARVIAKMPPLVLADLNSCETDQCVIAPYLDKLAAYGSGVIIFSRSRPGSRNTIGSIAEMGGE